MLLKSLCFPGCSVVNNPPTNAGDAGAAGLIPGSGRCPVVGAWWAAVHGFAKSWMQLSTHTHSPWNY